MITARYKMITQYAYTLLTACLLYTTADSQTPEQKLNAYSGKLLQEKLYMHTDRDFYLAGDIIWFKLYNVDASLHQPLDISKVAYIEILDAANKPAAQAKVGMDSGRGNGSLYLPVSIKTGNYKIRAYTQWMKNAGADYFFEKNITIVNPQKQRENTNTVQLPAPSVQFFPEGGHMVNGLRSRVAFKAVSDHGKGLACSGKLVDEQNNTITTFTAGALGMGSFYITPQAGRSYKAVVDIEGKSVSYPFPQAQGAGFVIELTDTLQGQIHVQVRSNLSSDPSVYLLAHTRQMVKYAVSGKTQHGNIGFAFDRNKLGDGISHFTLFSANGQPLCERLYFKYPENPLAIQITGNDHYGTRSKITLDITSNDKQGSVQDADMSLAVYQLDELQGVEEQNISSYLLLSSDLKGHIESAGYYFRNITPAVKRAMDDLVLTQGWRRFQWNDVLQDKIPATRFAPEYNGHFISGRVVNSSTGAAIPGVEAYASAPGLSTGFMVATSDADGRLLFEMRGTKGGSEIIVQAEPAADSLARIEIASPFSENYTVTPVPVFSLPASRLNALLEQNLGTQVQNVYTGTELKKFAAIVDTIPFFEKPTNRYMLDDYTRFSTMEEVLREYVSYLDVRKRQGGFSIPLLDFDRKTFYDANPLILVDGVPVFDINKLMAFDPLKMRKLEVVNNIYFIGNTYFKGIMNWQTYKGDLAGYELNPRSTVIDYEGLQSAREFYMPVYDTPEKMTSRIPDFRNVLYWSGNMNTVNGKKKVELYSSDKKGKYVAIVQGLTPSGNAGTGLMYFEVK